MRIRVRNLLLIAVGLLVFPLVYLISNGSYSGPVKFKVSSLSENEDFEFSPKEIVVTLQATEKDRVKIAEETKIRLLNSKSDLGYPMASYKIEGESIKYKLPILEPGYYIFDFNVKTIPFSIGVNNIKRVDKAVDCLNEEKESRCLSIYFREKALKIGRAKPILDEMFKLTEDYPETLYLCHNYSHSVGQVAAFIYETYDEAVKDGFDVCHFGYYHGVMESFSSIFTTEELKANFAILCDKYAIGMNRGDCTHGLGHIAWWRTGGDFDEGVKICQLASEKVTIGFFRDMDSCVTGIAMEWSNAYLAAPKVIKDKMTEGLDDPAMICKRIEDDKLASGCWEFIGPVWGGSDKNINHMIKICESLDGVENEGCWLGLGRDNAFRPEVTAKSAVETCLTAKLTSAMWLCQSNVVHSKTVTTRIPGTAKLVCEIVPKNTLNFQYQCIGLQQLENERLNAEGRNQLTGQHEQESTFIGEASPSQNGNHN